MSLSLASICCFRACFQGEGFDLKPTALKAEDKIRLDGRHFGNEVVLMKHRTRMCGTGGSLCTAPLVQNKSYFEVKVHQGGVWSVGVATRNADLSKAPGGADEHSWVLGHDGTIKNNGTVIHSEIDCPADGGVVGVTYDHIELNFFINGKPIDKPVTGIKGTVYPALYVDDGAVLEFVADGFAHQPLGFDSIMLEKSLL